MKAEPLNIWILHAHLVLKHCACSYRNRIQTKMVIEKELSPFNKKILETGVLV